MKNTTKLFIIALTGIFLAGCFGTITPRVRHGYFAKKAVRQATLANGQKIHIGELQPDDSWQCQQLAVKEYNWSLTKLETLNIDGFDFLKKKAIDYANQQKLSPNYIFMRIPTEVDIGGLPLTAMSNAEIYYYQCKTIPLN